MVAGLFTNINSTARAGLVRLNPNGTVDPSFSPNIQSASFFSSTFGDIDVQSDGKVLLGGVFLNNFFLGANISFPLGALVVRFGANGGIDPAFTKVESFGGGLGVLSLYVTTGDKFVIGGQFSLNTSNGLNHNVARINSDGTPDVSFFQPGLNSLNTVYDVIPSGTQIVIGGDFRSVGSVKRGRIAGLNSDGTIDGAYASDTGANASILALDLESSGKVVMGGQFTRYDQRGRNFVGRISLLGNVDSPFSINTGADRSVYAVALQSDKKVIIAGEFGYFNWVSSNSIARILPTGQIDPSFNTGFGVNGLVRAIAIQPNGNIIFGGQFETYNNVSRTSVVRVLPNGSIDPAFNPGSGTTGTVYAVWVQGDGKILLGGDFLTFSGHPALGLIRLNANGSYDNTFDIGSGFNGSVSTIAVMRDSLIFVGGDFTGIQGATRTGIARLQMNGSLVPALNIGQGLGAGAVVYSIAFQKNKQVVVGGFFDDYNGNPIKNVVRMSPTGVFDPSFNPGLLAEGPVYDIAIDSATQKIIVVGQFEGKAVGRNGIVRMKTSGSKDATMGGGDGGDGVIIEIEEDPDGGFLIAGDFTAFDDDARNRVARLNDDEVTVTTWDGTSWDFGSPDGDMANILHCIIDGDYNNTHTGYICEDLFINFGTAFDPSTDVEVHGNALSNSTLTEGRIVLNSAAGTQSFEGYANNLTIDNTLGVSLNGPSWVKGTLKLQSGTLVTNDDLTLVSNASGTARLAKVEPGAGLVGNATVQRYVPGGAAGWHLMGTPVESQTQAHWTDDFTIIGGSIFLHNEAGILNVGDEYNGWERTSGSITHGRGYRVWLNQSFFNSNPTFDNTGTVFTGTFFPTLSFSPAGYGAGGWNLVANPYPCEIDWDQIYPSQTSMDNQVHVWIQDHYGSYAGGVSVSGGVRYLPSNQGFFTKASTSSPAPSLTITEDAKPASPQTNTMLRVATNQPIDVAMIQLVSEDGHKDEAAIRLKSDATVGFDAAYDANKLPNPGLNVYSLLSNGTKTAIQARPFDETIQFDLGYSASASGNYELRIDMGSEIFGTRHWFLKDNTLGTFVPVLQNQVLNFPITSTELTSDMRFQLIGFTEILDAKPLLDPARISIVPNPVKDVLCIWNSESVISASLWDITGREVLSVRNSQQGNMRIPTAHLPSGIYHLNLKTKEGIVVEKIVVQ